MTSRSIAGLALALTAAVTAAGCAHRAPGSADDLAYRGDFRGPLGVQLYSFRDAFRTDVPGTLARVRALGIRDVELAGTYGLSAAQFRAALDAAGLSAS